MNITETTFSPKRYLALKKSVSMAEIENKQMYEDAGKKLGAYLTTHGLRPTGPWSVLYFTWDTEHKTTDIAIAFPVANLDHVDDAELSIVDIGESKASMIVLEGPYEQLGALHNSLMEYNTEKGYAPNTNILALEEYEVGYIQDTEPAHWKTNIYHFCN